MEFCHPRPADVSEHERLFECEVRFGADACRVLIPRASWDTPRAGSDPDLFCVLDAHARMLLDQLPPAADLVGRVREAIELELRGGDPSLESVAGRLTLSPRTLQRRLRDHGVGFNDVLDEMASAGPGPTWPGRRGLHGDRLPARLRRAELVQPRLQALERSDAQRVPPPDRQAVAESGVPAGLSPRAKPLSPRDKCAGRSASYPPLMAVGPTEVHDETVPRALGLGGARRPPAPGKPPAPQLHVGNLHSSCFFDLHPELTQQEFEEFADEIGSILRFRQLGETTTLGKGKWDVSLQYTSSSIDDTKGAWNNTMSHPDADHYLGSSISFPRIVARFGVSERVDLGVWGSLNPRSNYGMVGVDTRIALLRQDPRDRCR